MKEQNNLLTLTPLEVYETPEISTLKEATPEILKEVPSSWKKKAVLGTMGMLGLSFLSACTTKPSNGEEAYVSSLPYEVELPPELPNWSIINNGQHCWMHHGGSGGGPVYVVYLTEQEALGIVRAELESVGLVLAENERLPKIEIEEGEDRWVQNYEIEIGLINEEHQIAISLVEPQEIQRPFFRFNMEGIPEMIEDEFTVHHPDLSLALFCNPHSWLGWWERDEASLVTDEDKDEAHERLVANLIAQTQSFIQHLRAEETID